jgi:DNA end-binding protein Ku
LSGSLFGWSQIFAVIRETIRSMDKVAIGRVVLTSREHIIGLEPLKNGLMGTLLRYPYEVRSEDQYFDDIQDVKVTKDMLDLAKHIVNQKSATFDPEKFEDHYEAALAELAELINQKRSGKTIAAKPRPRRENVVDLMDALKRSIGRAEHGTLAKGKKPRKVAAGQKGMLLPINSKRDAKEEPKKADKRATSRTRKSA